MVYAVIYADGDIVATYSTEDEARSQLGDFITAHPTLQDEIGLRPYEGGRAAGEWTSAADVLSGQIKQPHLV